MACHRSGYRGSQAEVLESRAVVVHNVAVVRGGVILQSVPDTAAACHVGGAARHDRLVRILEQIRGVVEGENWDCCIIATPGVSFPVVRGAKLQVGLVGSTSHYAGQYIVYKPYSLYPSLHKTAEKGTASQYIGTY